MDKLFSVTCDDPKYEIQCKFLENYINSPEILNELINRAIQQLREDGILP